ncbi:sensor histidine kinase [Sphingomonas solaris]|uniref:histidine kinase n=1 Tax=Alterirhizorhabdus solaris TaxID=2529389 RepID=A0A558QQX4_9SPHN|nr:histidine kinase dimerization/phospho-acceptor domain-containing protein [Sphingomonas solaris]TVV69529.1 HAMP domain-containing histidine kinase [Sphingomonas solaris]
MAVGGGLYGSGLPADSLRQLVHELRTPLNAIVGFGEMIERQVLGPAALRYRVKAGVIVEQGRRLLAVVDDLDMAASAGETAPERSPDRIAPADLLRRLWRTHRPIAAGRGVMLEMAIEEEIGPIDADPAVIERIYARLITAAIGLGHVGERIEVRLTGTGDAAVLRLTRPAVLGDSSETTLLDPGFTPEGDWPEAPLLGLGFSLRLVRNLAAAAGGALAIEADGFVLRLPVAGRRKANGVRPC